MLQLFLRILQKAIATIRDLRFLERIAIDLSRGLNVSLYKEVEDVSLPRYLQKIRQKRSKIRRCTLHAAPCISTKLSAL